MIKKWNNFNKINNFDVINESKLEDELKNQGYSTNEIPELMDFARKGELGKTLAENGKNLTFGLLDAIYTFKPTHIKPIKQIDNYTIYKVYGSKFQSYTYFKRFGEHAIILNDNSFKQSQLISAQKIINNYNSISSQLEEELNQ